MSRMSSTYGSELHLLRYLGRHRDEFERRILGETGGDSVRWLEFGYDDRSKTSFDLELKGIEFLHPSAGLQRAWTEFWPQGSGIQTWDAVGELKTNGRPEWLLIEAKAHLAEVRSDCQARGSGGKGKIERAFAEVKRELGASSAADWTCTYYQFANRLAALYFLQKHLIPARLLFVYFCGDTPGPQRECPPDADGWQETLKRVESHIGLPDNHQLSGRIHKLFVPVRRQH